ncbi:unnamed protein product [Parnassius mnemosyne]|uniref:DDE Tnp4 domain-containing protein n=1 Tax=Parnassius mnemosyne TaxID=213953 RepID=A0AAV1KL28_9NEOP
MEQEVVQQFDMQPPSASITLDGFTHTTQTSAHCFVPACSNIERNRVPEYLRKIILKTEKIFVTLEKILLIPNPTRNDLINRNLLLPEGLFGNKEARVPIIICDDTYIYLQKSSNYMFQKHTYSLHKYRKLKPFLIVATNGYIIDILGPYPATKSNSDIMKALFQNENEGLRAFFSPMMFSFWIEAFVIPF